MFIRILSIATLLLLSAIAAASQWQMQSLSTKASFRGLSVVSNKIVWASGTGGAFVKTTDGGQTWQVGQVAVADKLDFRDVEAFDAQTAYLLSIGNGAASRIYKTTDGGQNWQLQFQNVEPEAFYDAIAFWDRQHGLAMSDPVRGKFVILKTDDGGAHWQPVNAAGMPPAIAGEGGFAASGSCLIAVGKTEAYLVSGGAAARVFYSKDRGATWAVAETPLPKGAAGAGVFSAAFTKQGRGIIVGGDYQKPAATDGVAAWSADRGKTFTPAARGPAGFRSAVAFAPGAGGRTALAAGTSGTDVTRDGGRTWTNLDGEKFNALAFAPDGTVWAAGPNGRLGKLPARVWRARR
jgi:photosystem II stability/assembly factor-like uncharacterized protein